MSSLLQPPLTRDETNEKAGPAERTLTLLSGSLLLLPLIAKRSAWRWTAAAAGGALIYTGITATRTASQLPGMTQLPTDQRIRQSITIGKDALELYALWRNPDAMARIIRPLGTVIPFGAQHVRWRVRLPLGKLESEAVLAEENPGQLVHWRSIPDSKLQIDEVMHFEPAPNNLGTVATLEYYIDFSRVPAAESLRFLATLVEMAPRAAVRKILHSFKSLAETGEIPTLERNPSARGGRSGRKGDLA